MRGNTGEFMNFVYFKVEYPRNEGSLSSPLYLNDVVLLRDGDIVAELGDLKITHLPYCIYRSVPTGFRKIEYRLQTHSVRRITLSCGYLKSGEYIVNTPQGEEVLIWNALSGLWTRHSDDEMRIDGYKFVKNHYTIIRPHRRRSESLNAG